MWNEDLNQFNADQKHKNVFYLHLEEPFKLYMALLGRSHITKNIPTLRFG